MRRGGGQDGEVQLHSLSSRLMERPESAVCLVELSQYCKKGEILVVYPSVFVNYDILLKCCLI